MLILELNEGNFLKFINDNFELNEVFCFEPIKYLSEKLHEKQFQKKFLYKSNRLIK